MVYYASLRIVRCRERFYRERLDKQRLHCQNFMTIQAIPTPSPAVRMPSSRGNIGRHAILLFHGLRSSPGELLSVVGPLRAAGYKVITPQYKGYSDSRDSFSVGHWQDWLEEALKSFDFLIEHFDSVSLGGLCSGAILALAVATRRSDQVRALTLLSPTLFYDGWALPWLVRLRHLGYYTPLRYFWSIPERAPYGVKNPQMRQWIEREMAERKSSVAGAARLPLASIFEVEQLIRHIKPQLSRIVSPALLLHAREDEVTSLRSPHFLMKHLGSRDKRLIVLEDSYHMITLDNDRRRVIAEMRNFLLEHTPQAIDTRLARDRASVASA